MILCADSPGKTSEDQWQKVLTQNKQLQGAFFFVHILKTWLAFPRTRAMFLVLWQGQDALFSRAKLALNNVD